MAWSKYYVVWKGLNPWIYTNRSDCKMQVDGFLWAQYKSFPNEHIARLAYENNLIWHKWQYDKSHLRMIMDESFDYSICTDAACPSNPWPIEYRWVIVSTGQEIFSYGPYQWWSVNIAEFLAIVAGLQWLSSQSQYSILYTDSKTALWWVQTWKINTTISKTSQNKQLWVEIEESLQRLQSHTWRQSQFQLLKRPTSQRGQIPADFWRK